MYQVPLITDRCFWLLLSTICRWDQDCLHGLCLDYPSRQVKRDFVDYRPQATVARVDYSTPQPLVHVAQGIANPSLIAAYEPRNVRKPDELFQWQPPATPTNLQVSLATRQPLDCL